MDWLPEYLADIIPSALASTALVGFLTVIFRNVVTEFFVGRLKTTQEKRLEEFKHELDKVTLRQQRDHDFVKSSLESFRNRRTDKLTELQFKAIQEIWNTSIVSRNFLLQIQMLENLKLDVLLEKSGDQKIREFINMIAPQEVVDKINEQISERTPTEYRPFAPSRIWDLYSAKMAMTGGAVYFFTIVRFGMGDRKLMDFDSLATQIAEALPDEKENFEKAGWQHMFSLGPKLENELVAEIRRFTEGENIDLEQIKRSTRLAQATTEAVSTEPRPEIPADIARE